MPDTNRHIELTPELAQRLMDLAVERQENESEIVHRVVTDYLDWNDTFTKRIRTGLAAADRGEFASDAEIERVFSKYRAPS